MTAPHEPTAMQLAFLDGGRRYYARAAGAKPPPGPVDPLTAATTAIERHDERRDREHRERYVLPKIKRDIGLVELYHRRRTIDDQQRSACETLASLYEASGFKPNVTSYYQYGFVEGSSGAPGQGPKAPEFVQAIASIGQQSEPVVRAFVLENVEPEHWGNINSIPKDMALRLLREGLDNMCYWFKYKVDHRV